MGSCSAKILKPFADAAASAAITAELGKMHCRRSKEGDSNSSENLKGIIHGMTFRSLKIKKGEQTSCCNLLEALLQAAQLSEKGWGSCTRMAGSPFQRGRNADAAFPPADPEPGAGKPTHAAGPKRARLLVNHRAQQQFRKSPLAP